MKLLAFDTSSDALSLAVWVNGSILKEIHHRSQERHSSVLIPAVEKILKSAKLGIADIDVIAVGLGPGSFTGIRVAVVTAKMLAFALNKKIVGVSSLEAIARSSLSKEHPKVAVLLDARKAKVYGAAYEWIHGRVRETAKPALRAQADIEQFEKSGYQVITSAEPMARWIAEAGGELAKNKKFIPPAKLDPEYLHPRDCNVTIKK